MYFIRFENEFVGRSQCFTKEEILLGRAEADAYDSPEAAQEAIDETSCPFASGVLGSEFARTMMMIFRRQQRKCKVVHVAPRITAIKRDRR